jgi:imidazolonepropionase-like amidohydrolase
MKRKFVFLIVLFLLFTRVPRAENSRMAVKAERIYVGNGQIIKNGLLLIENGKIVKTGSNLSVPEGYDLYDFGKLLVIPGLVDSHTHIGEIPFPENLRTSDLNESSQALTPMADIRDALNYWAPTTFDLALAAGVTTVVALPGSSNVIGGIGTVVKTAGKELQKRMLRPEGILKIALGENPKSSGKANSRTPRTRMGVRFLLWKSFLEAREYKEKWDRYLQNSSKYPKPDLDLAKEPLRLALERKIPVHIHCARADDILIGCDLAKEFGLDVSLDHVYEGYLVADELAKRGIPVITGPDLSGWELGTEPKLPVNVSGILADAGVKVAIMTDGVHFCDLLLQASYAIRLGMKETDAMKAITLNAAEIAKVGYRVGSLEPGKDADFVVIDGPPFEVATRVVAVYIEGKKMYAGEEGR